MPSDETITPTLVKELREAIRAAGLGLRELGRRAGVDHAALSRFLAGERTLRLPQVSKLCDELGLHLCPCDPQEGTSPKGKPGAAPHQPPPAPKRPRKPRGKQP